MQISIHHFSKSDIFPCPVSCPLLHFYAEESIIFKVIKLVKFLFNLIMHVESNLSITARIKPIKSLHVLGVSGVNNGLIKGF